MYDFEYVAESGGRALAPPDGADLAVGRPVRRGCNDML
jgi:hypothetical protein